MIQRTITINGKTTIGYAYEQPTNAEQAKDVIILERTLRQREGGYFVGGHWFHSDPESKLQQISLFIAGLSLPPNLQWRTLDNAFVTMTPTLAQAIFQKAIANETEIFMQAEAKKIEVSQAGYDFTQFDPTVGWTQAYWEV